MKSFLPSSTSPILTNLLLVLSENGRLASAPKVFADFNTLMSAYRGELEVIVTSAEQLDSKALSRLEKALKGTEVAQGKTLKISNRVNAALIGGLVVDFGDKSSMSNLVSVG
jgi:F-type H+-transporting ATPase subunit O